MNLRLIIYGALGGLLLAIGCYGKGYLDADEKAAAAARSVRAQDVAIAKQMEPQLVQTLAISHTVTVTLTRQVTRYVDRYIPAPGAASEVRPAYYLTDGAVGLWNAALGAGPAGAAPGTVAGAGGLGLSPVRFDDAEANAILNFGQYRDCRTIVKGWQDWYRRVSEVKP